MGGLGRNEREVGGHPRGEVTVVSTMQYFGTTAGCRADDGPGREERAVMVRRLLGVREHPHLIKHRQRVAGGRAVRAEAEADAELTCPLHRGHPLAGLRVAADAVGDAGAAALHKLQVLFGHVDAVRRERMRIQRADRIEEGGRGHTHRAEMLHFVVHLGGMQGENRVVLHRKLMRLAQLLR